ncbi:hypothetical protein ACFYSC_18755 [Streptosporangium sp. NPDC004379]|uniref:hypothetical protein n=1 Tax=Streptosporangium sp. NPDC004379 TaxID=3366189 RepID=UPI0036901ED1
MYRTGLAALLLVVLAGGCGSGSAVKDVGTVFHGSVGRTVDVRVAPGARFTLAVDDDRPAGDDWEMGDLPDVAVASFISEESGPASGAAGPARYFVFNAKRPGTTTVTISNCRRCPDGRTPPDDVSRRASGDALFRIAVG